MAIYDWATGEPICGVCGYVEGSPACDAFCGEIDDAYADEDEGDGFGLFPVVDRIRQYTQADDAVIQMEVAAVEAYIDRGIECFERLLSNHAAFDAFLAERGEASE